MTINPAVVVGIQTACSYHSVTPQATQRYFDSNRAPGGIRDMQAKQTATRLDSS